MESVIKSEESKKATSADDHKEVRGKHVVDAMALAPSEVKEPDIPVMIFLDEVNGLVIAALRLLELLCAVGMPAELVDTLAGRCAGLRSAQAVWQTVRRDGRSNEGEAVIGEALSLRADVLAAAKLALRNHREGQRRLALIREGDGLAEVIGSLTDLAVLILEFRQHFELIHFDVDAKAAKLGELSEVLAATLAAEDTNAGLSHAKELRDRIYTLCLEPLGEIRAFAEYAFRGDRNNRRRSMFTSQYHRERNRRVARRAREAKLAEQGDSESTESSVADKAA